MTGHALVIVESPAKAKTINKYLGNNYTVIASLGHVRDLPSKDGSVLPDEDFRMSWELSEKGKKQMREIIAEAKTADRILLATDPDREGEAISWHVWEVLKDKKLGDRPVDRITFNEITKTAVQTALKNPRRIDEALVHAYLARRALDYLVGFTLSPVLWRKLPGSKSAGRVQSVALRLICERELEIERFKPQEYWSLPTILHTEGGEPVPARLSIADGRKLERLSIKTQAEASALATRIRGQGFTVADIEEKQVKRRPQPPFITSSLQMEASRRLGYSASHTMRCAQGLYEAGLITYMRTDGTNLSDEAIREVRDLIKADYGPQFVPPQPILYKSKAKNAQEAHEAIRPTDITRKPGSVAGVGKDEQRLYDLIWRRTMACEMESAVFKQVAVDMVSRDGTLTLRATGSILTFEGHLKVYGAEVKEDPAPGEEEGDDRDRRLPALSKGQALVTESVSPTQHFTQPPPRYSEASLVKRMEELGIGRPSTYASVLQLLQDRAYVKLDSRRFVPEDRGRLVTAFLEAYFERYVEYDFTAQLEEQLDDISGGRVDWREVLRAFWMAFSSKVDETKDLKISDVIDVLDAELGHHFFPSTYRDGSQVENPRACPACKEGRLGLKLARNGAFIGCSNYPQCTFTRPLEVPADAEEAEKAGGTGERHLGDDPETGLPVFAKNGPYGPYVQLGPKPEEPGVAAEEPPKGKKKAPKEKPKRSSLLDWMSLAEIDLETALRLLSLPRDVGVHPEDGQPITAAIGRFGPYLKHGDRYVNLPKDDDSVLVIGLNRAVTVIAEAPAKRGGGRGAAAKPLKDLGAHPESGEAITVHDGRYGPYVKMGKINATLPKDLTPDALSLERAVEILAEKAAKAGVGKKAPAKKAPAKKAATSKSKASPAKDGTETPATAKKPAARKTAAKKAPASKAAAKKPAAAKTAPKRTEDGKTGGGPADETPPWEET